MIDFLMISTRSTKRGVIEIYPKFIIKKSSDLMIRGGDFYAIWLEDRGLWSTDEQDALQLIDRELDKYAEENRKNFDSSINPLDKEHRDKREALYLEVIKKYNKQEQELFPELAAQTVLALEENPEQDFLGSIFMSLNLGNEHNGQIFTPYHVCELMAEMTMDDTVKKIEQDGYISINDPCCGAGATLIAGIHAARKQLEKANLNYQNHLLVVAQDIDETVALMCYIQLSLLGVAGYVKVGNSLTEPMTDNDNKENYWFTPMYYSNVWVLRRIFGGR